jgi:histidine triad (HIT) family protein
MSRPANAAQENCTFCNLIRGAAEVSVCFEDADAIAFMDTQPVNAGHVLVVPRVHYESLLDVPADLGVHLFRVTMHLADAVRRVTGCEGMNLVVNSGQAAGQDEPHYHVHIIPRRASDGFDIPLPFGGSAVPDRTMLDAIAAQIISATEDPMRDREAAARTPREQPVAVPMFADVPRNTARRPDAQPRRAPEPRAYEGAHGELCYDWGDGKDAA